MSWIGRHRVRILFVALVLLCFLIFMARMKSPERLNWLDRALIWTTAPIQHAFVWVCDGISGFFNNYVFLIGLREENAQLQKQVDELQRDLTTHAELKAENRRLGELVNIRGALGGERLVSARVVAVGTSPVARTIRIAAGDRDGVRFGDAVVAGTGLVGRVTGTVPGYAEVRLLTDGRSAVDVVDQRSRARAILRCQGEDSQCSLEHLLRTADVEIGDRMVTSGLGGVYPRGLLVGIVSRVTSPTVGVFREAVVEPAVEFETLEEVLVVGRESK